MVAKYRLAKKKKLIKPNLTVNANLVFCARKWSTTPGWWVLNFMSNRKFWNKTAASRLFYGFPSNENKSGAYIDAWDVAHLRNTFLCKNVRSNKRQVTKLSHFIFFKIFASTDTFFHSTWLCAHSFKFPSRLLQGNTNIVLRVRRPEFLLINVWRVDRKDNNLASEKILFRNH